MAILLGIDEAGRGSVLGPLVVAGYSLDESEYGRLAALPLADSKAMEPQKRVKMARELARLGGLSVLRFASPAKIDRAVEGGGLNALEIVEMVAIIKRVKPGVVYVDALTSKPARFGLKLKFLVGDLRPRIVSENRADQKYPLVQAASILAKVSRDRALARIRRVHPDAGSGYPSDLVTRAFLRKFRDSGRYPVFVRRSWRTLSRLGNGAGVP